MNTNQQLSLFRPNGQPDEEAIRMIRGYEKFALSLDPRGYCVCTSEGKDSRVLGHLLGTDEAEKNTSNAPYAVLL